VEVFFAVNPDPFFKYYFFLFHFLKEYCLGQSVIFYPTATTVRIIHVSFSFLVKGGFHEIQ
jgi:hypothetical protein